MRCLLVPSVETNLGREGGDKEESRGREEYLIDMDRMNNKEGGGVQRKEVLRRMCV